MMMRRCVLPGRERASRHNAPHGLVQPRQPSAAAVFADGVEAVLWTPSSNNEWGGTLWEVAVLAGIAGDLWSYRGLAASVDVLVWRLPEEEFAAIVGVSVNIDSHVFRRIGQS